MVAQLIENYYYLEQDEKARDLAVRMGSQLMETISFFIEWGSLGATEFETASRVYLYIADVCKQYGDKELSREMTGQLEALLHSSLGAYEDLEAEADSLDLD